VSPEGEGGEGEKRDVKNSTKNKKKREVFWERIVACGREQGGKEPVTLTIIAPTTEHLQFSRGTKAPNFGVLEAGSRETGRKRG